MDKRFMAIIAIVIAAFVGLAMFAGKNNETGNISGDNAQTTQHMKGAGTSQVTLQEFGDFQCSACARYYPLIKELENFYGDELAFQFIHFPLVQIHKNAFAAHKAVEAAGRQDKFFEMHDIMYEQQQLWESVGSPASVFEGYAAQLGLDIEKYKVDVVSSEVNSVINADIRSGQDLNINSTPSFILNGKKIDNPSSLDEFKALIDAEIAAQKTNTTSENQ